MKILYHHRTLGDGAEGIHIREMVDALRELGHKVQVVSLVGEQTNTATPQRHRWELVSRLLPGSVYELAELGYNVVGTRKLMQAIQEFQPDLIYDRYNSYCTAALRAARRAKLPVLLEVNSPVAYERAAYERLQLKFPRLAKWYERIICMEATHTFVVSTPLKDHLTQLHGIPAERITILPNGANPNTFHPAIDGSSIRQRYDIEDCTVIGFVGILRPWHGIELLLDAFVHLCGRYKALHLLIVGNGPIENELKARVQQLGIGARVTFTGRVPHAEVSHHVAAMDIPISPRATFYASPMKILEYMAMAKAVVAPNMANIRDIICHGQDGQLFKPESVDSLREQLEILLQRPEQRAAIGEAARQKIETSLNWQHNAQQVVDIGSLISSTKAR